MQISDIHALALQLLNSDTSDYDSAKLMTYTNPGIYYVQNLRVSSKDPEVIKELVITGTITKPSDFFAFFPPTSQYPVNAMGSTISLAVGAPPSVKFRYSTKVSRVNSSSDNFPLPDEYADIVASYISTRLQSDNSMNVQQDIDILDRDTNAFAKAKGG
jgi:hypothetical protein